MGTRENSRCDWIRRQPGRVAALGAMFPDLTFECVIQDNGCNPVLFQTIIFHGSRAACERFAPGEAFGRQALNDWYIDEHGDRWKVDREGHCYRGVVHSDRDTKEIPDGARRWPQSGLSRQVDRLIRKAFAKSGRAAA